MLIACSGSIASILMPEIVDYAINLKCFNIKVILTNSAKYFTDMKIGKDKKDYTDFETSKNCNVYIDNDEWNFWDNNKEVLHIELRKWADFLLLAPLSANTLAKIANGIADNLLTSVVKAWDYKKPIFYALAMNTFMYNNSITQKHQEILNKELFFIEIPVVSKKLKCGDSGKGALAQISDIFKEIMSYINRLTIPSYFPLRIKLSN